VLASVPSNTPVATFLPYLGDYVYLAAAGSTFYGVFSANNAPDMSHFPNGVSYQRNANFTTKTLLNVDNTTPVNVSIDPFFFSIAGDLDVLPWLSLLLTVQPQPDIVPWLSLLLTP